MIPSTYPALLAALLALGACATSDDQRDTATDPTGPVTGTGTTAGTTGATTGAPDSSSGGTTHASHGETGTTAEATSAPTTGEATTGEATTGGALGCDAYCATISANCSGENAQFGSLETCLATCATYMPGLPEDTGGNTLGCRTYHAGAAAGEPAVHCSHAGPGGGGACGANCDGFCSIAAVACPDAWADEGACQTACATFPPEEPYDATDVAGDTFACRLYHLTAAALDPVTHCGHIKGDSPPCK